MRMRSVRLLPLSSFGPGGESFSLRQTSDSTLLLACSRLNSCSSTRGFRRRLTLIGCYRKEGSRRLAILVPREVRYCPVRRGRLEASAGVRRPAKPEGGAGLHMGHSTPGMSTRANTMPSFIVGRERLLVETNPTPLCLGLEKSQCISAERQQEPSLNSTPHQGYFALDCESCGPLQRFWRYC
jgi:hypothetical protein